MSLQISEEYERVYQEMLRLGLIRPDEDVNMDDADYCAGIRINRGQYRLSVDAVETQWGSYLVVYVKDLHTGEEVFSVDSPLKDAQTSAVQGSWSVSLADSVRSGGHPRVYSFFQETPAGRHLLTCDDLPWDGADLIDPLSKTMFNFVRMLLAWFRTLN